MIGDCDNCGFQKIELSRYKDGYPVEEHLLCEVCSSTHLSKAILYPNQCSDPSLYQSIGWIANKILEKLNG